MDRLVQKMSMRAAKTSSRRDFFSSMIRGAVGVGLGASFLFAGESAHALAVKVACGGNVLSNQGCAGTGCSVGDSNGCTGFGTDNSHPGYCTDCNGNQGCSNTTGNNKAFQQWTCCCNGRKSTCVDCGPSGGSMGCICKVDPGQQC